MIWLILALLTSTLIMVCFKLFPKYGIDSLQAIATNYLVAFIAGCVTVIPSGKVPFIAESWFPVSIASGVLLILVFFVFASSTSKVGIAITSVCSKMSVLIPVTLGFLIFGESAGILKIIGIIISLPAFYFIFKRNEHFHLKSALLILPILLFLGNGTNDSLLKTAQFYFLRSDNDLVNYLTSAFGIAFCIGVLLVTFISIRNKKRIEIKNIFAGILLGLLNWYSTLFFLKGLTIVDVTVFVPVFNAGIVCLGALTGLILFREKMGRWNVFGLGLALVAILLIALGNG
jgi:drug/metabolite transporter (DMT)-like permease